MRGCGTISPVAILKWDDLQVAGSDISGDCVSCAKRNVFALGTPYRLELPAADIVKLEEKGIVADIIAADPPYGIARPATSELIRLYEELLEEAYKILTANGKMVIVTPHSRLVERMYPNPCSILNRSIGSLRENFR